jgi:hypothetical protein
MPKASLKHLVVPALIVAAQTAALYALGQPPICVCGEVKLWEGDVRSSGNSQHLADWYSFTHVEHGFVFYLLTWLVAPRAAPATRLLFAMGAEALWEIAENSPFVIHAYRQQALAQGYVGDSIVNSLSDLAMMTAGFLLAARLPATAIVCLALATEIGLALAIHDNLSLNLLNFIAPIPAVTRWQSGW